MSKENKTQTNETTELTTVESTNITEITDDSGACFMVADSGHKSYSSLTATTTAEKKLLFNIINSPKFKLQDQINLTIEVKDIYAETCEYVSKETGELIPGVRIILVDKDGNSYSTSSKGVFNSLTKIFQIFGLPHQWEAPIPIRVKQLAVSNDRKVLTLEAV